MQESCAVGASIKERAGRGLEMMKGTKVRRKHRRRRIEGRKEEKTEVSKERRKEDMNKGTNERTKKGSKEEREVGKKA